MGRPFVSTLARWGAFAALSAVVTLTGSAHAVPADIDHLLVLVFDQMRPDYVDRFNLQHFKEIRAESRNYPAAYVGHLGSQTVVSHLVIPTGLLPRELPWLPSGTFLPARLRKKTGQKVIAIGEKDYSTTLLGTPAADAIVTLAKTGGTCRPAGMNVPAYSPGVASQSAGVCIEPQHPELTSARWLNRISDPAARVSSILRPRRSPTPHCFRIANSSAATQIGRRGTD